MRSGITVISSVLACLLVFVMISRPVYGQDYRIRYEHYLFATGGAAVPILDEGILNSTSELYVDIAFPGELADNSAHVRYFADLPRGSIGSYTFATGDVTDFWPYGFTATGRVERIAFDVDLDFDVEAGSYPDGVDVSVTGVVHGSLSATTDAGAWVQYSISFVGYTSLLKEIGVEEATVITFIEPFAMTSQIVGEGAVLPTPETYRIRLQAGIMSNRTWAVLGGTSPNYTTGSSTVDVYSGMQFTDVIVPEGVTWTSPDDVFMSWVTGDNVPREGRPLALYQNVPNPFNPATTIRFELPRESHVKLNVYDVRGALVTTLIDGHMSRGLKEVLWTGKDDGGRAVSSGIYFYRLVAGNDVETRKMVLLR